MVIADNIDFVLRNLVDLWTARLPALADYLQATFCFTPVRPLEVSRLFIAQMADGDVATGNIGGLFSRKWVLRGDVLESVALDYDYDKMYDTDQADEIYLSPSFLYCYQGDAVLLSERYGPGLKHRLRGQIVNIGQPSIEWVTLWSTAR